MGLTVHTLQRDDLVELSGFLTAGFAAGAAAEFAAVDVLRWKYLEPIGGDDSPRGFVAHHDGRIVGYVGLCPTGLVVGDDAAAPIRAAHPIDWLAAKVGLPIGPLLMEQVFNCTAIQFIIGGTDVAQRVNRRLGYAERSVVPEFCRVLRPGHRLRSPCPSRPWRPLLQVARDYGRAAVRWRPAPASDLRLQPVTEFGPEIATLAATRWPGVIHTTRPLPLLNHLLCYPRHTVSGWHLREADQLVGFALLSLISHGKVRVGRIVDCCLAALDPPAWRAALHLLTAQVRAAGADLVVCYGTTPWMAAALQANGFHRQRLIPLLVRDPNRLLPPATPFFLTHLEADHAYL